MRVLVTGGGTGGHIYPALAIIKGLAATGDHHFFYIGSKKGMEADIVPREGIPFAGIEIEGLPRTLSPRLIRALGRVPAAVWQARRYIKEFSPQVVVGTGGYVSGPVFLAALLAGVPFVIHEQNAYPGLTNRLLASRAATVCATFEDSVPRFPAGARVVVTGLPVRPGIGQADRKEARIKLGLVPEKKTLLVFGGSRGARSINMAMVEAYRYIGKREDLQVLHATGRLTHEETLTAMRRAGIDPEKNGNIKIVPYLYEMEMALAAADLVVCRAGAATIAEITLQGLPSILIPYPYAAENHQEYNAMALVKRGAAVMIRDRELNGQLLWQRIEEILRNDQLRREMAERAKAMARPQALEEIVAVIYRVARKE